MDSAPDPPENRREEIRQRIGAIRARIDELEARRQGDPTRAAMTERIASAEPIWPPPGLPPTRRLPPASAASAGQPRPTLRGQAATLERLRVDRQLQEALACGPDPLHLAAMFGLDPKTAICYAQQLLTTAAEEHLSPSR